MRFADSELERVHRAILGSDGDALVKFMHKTKSGAPVGEFSTQVADVARELDWVDASGALTDLGCCVSASCREYLYWLERDGKLPFETGVPWLNPSYFAGRDVVEIGCGMGANLMSLHGHANCTGIEPFEVYRQMGSVLRKKQVLPEPRIIIADGEDIPLESDCADVVLCVAAHHYFDVVAVLAEISRILRPDGELFVVGWTLPEYLSALSPGRMTRNDVKNAIITLANTATYSLTKKRVFPARPELNTSRPIYPSAARLRIWMEAADIEADPHKVSVGQDCLQRGQKRAVFASKAATGKSLLDT